MLTKEKIIENKNVFLKINAKYNVLNKEILDFLGENLFLAPSTTNLDMYGCYPGGLVHGILESTKNSLEINNLLLKEKQLSKESIVKCSFIYQLGKTFMFVENTNEWSKKTLNKMYEFNKDLLFMKYNERSLYYVNKFKIELSEEEFQAILTQDTDIINVSTLSMVIKQGMELFIKNDKNE